METIQQIVETLQEAVRVVTSKPFQRAVVNITLAVLGAVSLFGIAGLATALFFQNFVPDQVLSSPVHLQYGSGLNPYGVASLTAPPPKVAQEYDISLSLTLPRSPPNLDRGNFMVSIYLLDAAPSPSLLSDASKFASAAPHDHDYTSSPASAGFGLTRSIVFHSRRPALVPYVDPVISMASRLLFVFWHLMFPERTEMCRLDVRLAEKVEFPRLAGLPKAAYVEVEAGQTIQIYEASLTLTAQLSGLRYLMFYYRLPTYLVFTFLFWVFEVLFMAGAFAFFTTAGGSAQAAQKQITSQRRRAIPEGQQEAETSDQPQSFPTYGKQPRLKHEPSAGVKREADEEEEAARLMADIPVAGVDADDEDDDSGEGGGEGGKQKDSGVGTSYSSEGKHSVRKRASRTALE